MVLLAPLLLGCGSTRPAEPTGPDALALAMETLVQAKEAKLVLASRWRSKAKVEAIRVEDEGGTEVARGSVVVTLEGLRVEAEEVRLTWLAEFEDLVLSASEVKLFRQRRGPSKEMAPYETKNIAMLTMANDVVHFFQ